MIKSWHSVVVVYDQGSIPSQLLGVLWYVATLKLNYTTNIKLLPHNADHQEVGNV